MNYRITSFLIICIILINLNVNFKMLAITTEKEIYYDDGTVERAWFKLDTRLDGMYAVRFTPLIIPSQIIKARYYIYDKPRLFKAHILDSNRLSIFEKSVTPSSTGWFDVDLSMENIIVKGDFYIAIEYIVAKEPMIGCDENKPDGRSWSLDEGKWTTLSQLSKTLGEPDGDFMIRAVVDIVQTGSGNPTGTIKDISVPDYITPKMSFSCFITAQISTETKAMISVGLEQSNPPLEGWVDIVKETVDSKNFEKTFELKAISPEQERVVRYSITLFYYNEATEEWIRLDSKEFDIIVTLVHENGSYNSTTVISQTTTISQTIIISSTKATSSTHARFIIPTTGIIPIGLFAGIIMILVATLSFKRRSKKRKKIPKEIIAIKKRCLHCGIEVRPEFSICPNCGEILGKDEWEETSP